jgi:hypothetical protein
MTREQNHPSALDSLLEETREMATSLRRISKQDRELEDVDYWRHRAGWFDDDKAMQDYNKGVAYYQPDDDHVQHSRFNTKGSGNSVGLLIKGLAILVAIGVAILLVRAVNRRYDSSSTEKERSSSRRERSDSSSRRSHSKSSVRRSRSRSKRDSEYALMEDETSRKSSRSNRSRSRRRSRSRSSRKRETETGEPEKKEVLV